MVLITNALAFSSTSMTVARVVLFLALAAAVGFRAGAAAAAPESRRTARPRRNTFPEFQERLLTYVERSEQRDPMLDLLAADTHAVAQRATSPSASLRARSIFAFATSAGAAGAVLLWLILAGPGFLGYGASLLWAGCAQSGAAGVLRHHRASPATSWSAAKRIR